MCAFSLNQQTNLPNSSDEKNTTTADRIIEQIAKISSYKIDSPCVHVCMCLFVYVDSIDYTLLSHTSNRYGDKEKEHSAPRFAPITNVTLLIKQSVEFCEYCKKE